MRKGPDVWAASKSEWFVTRRTATEDLAIDCGESGEIEGWHSTVSAMAGVTSFLGRQPTSRQLTTFTVGPSAPSPSEDVPIASSTPP